MEWRRDIGEFLKKKGIEFYGASKAGSDHRSLLDATDHRSVAALKYEYNGGVRANGLRVSIQLSSRA